MPSCNITALTRDLGAQCTFTPSGVSDRIYFFNVDDIPLENRYPGDDGFYPSSIFNGVDLFAIDIKSDSGKVTSSKSEDNVSRSLVATAIIDYAFDKFMPIDAALAFMNIGVIVPFDQTKAYVVMSPYRRTKYSCEFDSGDTFDSNHGFTITFTCSPVLYSCPMVNIGTGGIDLNSATTSYDASYYPGASVTAVTSISITDPNTEVLTLSLASNPTKQVKATVNPSTVKPSYSIQNTSIAKVSNDGIVTALSVGETVLAAYAGDKRDIIIVKVTA